MNTELVKAIDLIVEEKGISKDFIYDALESALASAYKKNFESKTNVKINIDRETGDIKVYSYMVVVDDYDDGTETVDEEGNKVVIPPEINPDAQILLEEAKEYKKDAKIGDEIEIEVTPTDFGRLAASTAKQVIKQKLREAEKEIVNEEFRDKQYELMIGMVALEDAYNYYIDLGKARGILPKDDIIPGETIEMGSNIKVYITKITEGPKGPIIKLSRKQFGFVKRLFEHEIPEIQSGDVLVYGVAREAGVRSKVAIYSENERIDAIGACIGEKGSRIAGILKELNGEKIDLVLYSKNPEEFIKNALAPAKDVIVSIVDDKHAVCFVNNDNLKLAIGKKWSNVRLASKLTKYELEIKSLEEETQKGNL
jgi:N utilization substance protein A